MSTEKSRVRDDEGTRALQAREEFEVEILDLRDWELPMFQETFATVGDFRNPTFSSPVVKAWNATIGSADGFVFLTPEYNHSIPGVLKNAIDSVFATFGFRNKPFGTVAYSGGIAAGTRAVEHLAHIGLEAEMVPLRNTVLLPMVGQAFDDAGEPTNPMTNVALTIMLDDLTWWGILLQSARAAGSLPPAFVRVRAAMAAAAPAAAAD